MNTVLKNLCFILRKLWCPELYDGTSWVHKTVLQNVRKYACVCVFVVCVFLYSFMFFVYFRIVLQYMYITSLYKMYFISIY